jgi:hypothetical protein
MTCRGGHGGGDEEKAENVFVYTCKLRMKP